MTFYDIDMMVDYYLNCVDWNMLRFCWENNYISPVNELNEFGEIIDSDLRVTGQDVLDALDDLGVPYSPEFKCELLTRGIR